MDIHRASHLISYSHYVFVNQSHSLSAGMQEPPSEVPANQSDTTSSKRGKRGPGSYKCSLCGAQGHISMSFSS